MITLQNHVNVVDRGIMAIEFKAPWDEPIIGHNLLLLSSEGSGKFVITGEMSGQNFRSLDCGTDHETEYEIIIREKK